MTEVDEAIALLTGIDVGLPNDNGDYPAHSFNAAVADRLKGWADVHKHDKASDAED